MTGGITGRSPHFRLEEPENLHIRKESASSRDEVGPSMDGNVCLWIDDFKW